MKTKLILLVALIPFLGFSCDCLPVFETPILYQLNTAKKVFKGELLSAKPKGNILGGYNYKFQVSQNIKGTKKGNTEVVSTESNVCNRFLFKKGSNYLIFVFENNNIYGCSANELLDKNFKLIPPPREYHYGYVEENTHYYNKLKKTLQEYSSSSATKLTEVNNKGQIIAEGTIDKNRQPLNDWKYSLSYELKRLLGSWKLKKVTSNKSEIENTKPPLMIYTFKKNGKVQMIAKNNQNEDINILQSFSTYIKNNNRSTKYIKIELAESELQFINPSKMIIKMNVYGGMNYHFEKMIDK